MIYHNNIHTLDGLDTCVRETTKHLRKHRSEFDSIVVTGMSGVVVGVPVSMRLRKPLVIVRKASDNSHHGCGKLINETKLGRRALFLDDFVAGGKTRASVIKALQERHVRVVAQYEYQVHEYRALGAE